VDLAQGKGLTLIGSLVYRSLGLVGRPGYRLDCRSIKEGSRVSRLIASFVESSNLCIFAFVFLGSCLAFLCVSFRACGRVLDKLLVIENGLPLLHPLCFRCGRFAGSSQSEVSHLYFVWHFSLATSDYFQS